MYIYNDMCLFLFAAASVIQEIDLAIVFTLHDEIDN